MATSAAMRWQARRLCTQLSSAASRAVVPHTSAAPARLFATQASTTPAILFDIDGVLLRGSEALPGAKATLERLESAGIPFAMLTNGGGCPEAEKAEKVSSILGHHIRPDRIILAHSPMRALVDTYKNDLVLVVGKDRALALAEAYGFNRVMTVTELHAAHAVAFPDRKPLGGSNFWYSDEELPIRAVMGFLDPEDYHRDLQLVTDVLRSRGRVGEDLVSGEDQVVNLYLSCPDFEYVNEHNVPRYGAGIFGMLLEHLFHQSTGRVLRKTVYGKPLHSTYSYALDLITRVAKEDFSFDGVHTIYAIGDNPASDIAGANGFGDPFQSVLVHTGMFDPVTAKSDNDISHPASITAVDVSQAIDRILEAEAAR